MAIRDRTVWDVFQDERSSSMVLRGPFDGFVEKAVRASTACLIMADHNRYSVDARAAVRMLLVRSHAERVVVLLGDDIVAGHPSCFRRDQIIHDPRAAYALTFSCHRQQFQSEQTNLALEIVCTQGEACFDPAG